MKLKQLLEQLNQLAKERPEALEMEIIHPRDDEGNGFQELIFLNIAGLLNGIVWGYIIGKIIG